MIRIEALSKKLVIYVVLLMLFVFLFLPFLITLDSFLATVAEKFFLSRFINSLVVPYETRLVSTLLKFAGVPTLEGTVSIIKNGQSLGTYISWNCIGWQSFVVLGISLLAGISERYTKLSKIQVLLIGFLGTFIFNIVRIAVVLAILYYFGTGFSTLIHKYGAVLLSLVWLCFFWWFSYSYVLDEKARLDD